MSRKNGEADRHGSDIGENGHREGFGVQGRQIFISDCVLRQAPR